MATKNTSDNRKAKGRFMDQPGQWVNKTSKSTMKKRAKAFTALEKSMKKK